MRIFFLSFLFLLIAVVAGIYWSFSQWSAPYVVGQVSVVIEPHRSTKAILHQLEEAGALPPSWQIMGPMFLDGRARSLKAGEYEFTSAMSPQQVIDKIARGQVVIHKFTIPEGWNSFQVRELLEKEPLLTGDVPATIPEGSVFPDTILFQRGQSRVSVVEKMQERMSDVLAKEWASRAEGLPLKSPQEALILASVIEKETGVADERPVVASVFYNRIAKGMRLQSDPTVVYGIEAARAGRPIGRALTSGDL